MTTNISANFGQVVVGGASSPASSDSSTLTIQPAGAQTTVDLSRGTAPVTVTVGGSDHPVVVQGNPVDNTFMMAGTQKSDITFQGGLGLNLFVRWVCRRSTSRWSIRRRRRTRSICRRCTCRRMWWTRRRGAVKQVGATLDLSQTVGQKQLVLRRRRRTRTSARWSIRVWLEVERDEFDFPGGKFPASDCGERCDVVCGGGGFDKRSRGRRSS